MLSCRAGRRRSDRRGATPLPWVELLSIGTCRLGALPTLVGITLITLIASRIIVLGLRIILGLSIVLRLRIVLRRIVLGLSIVLRLRIILGLRIVLA